MPSPALISWKEQAIEYLGGTKGYSAPLEGLVWKTAGFATRGLYFSLKELAAGVWLERFRRSRRNMLI